MVDFRTDLALECHEKIEKTNLKGIRKEEIKNDDATITLVEILDEYGAEQIGKPKGKYYTIDMPEFSHETELLDGRLKAITDVITQLLPRGEGTVLVAGIGNDGITPDALGPLCAEQIFSTRHLQKDFFNSLGMPNLNSVSSISTGVLGQTGIETAEYIKGVVEFTKPKAVVAVDALVARNLSRLGRTIQLSDTGISPGSGVGNHRNKINEELLGIPVIAIGVPTIVDVNTLVGDLLGSQKEQIDNTDKLMVTPQDIDLIIKRASRLLALGINCALQSHIEPEFLLSLM